MSLLVYSTFHFPFILRSRNAFHHARCASYLWKPRKTFLPFSHSSVIGNLVTVLNFKFWHLCGAAIRLLARHTARGFSRNPLIVLNTNNIYIHWDEAKFTAGFWGWLQDCLILNFLGLSCPPPRALMDCAAARGTLVSTPEFILQQMFPPPLPTSYPVFIPPKYLICVCAQWCHATWKICGGDLWSL